MRKLTLDARQFNNFVFPHVANATTKGNSEWETMLRVMKKLKDPKISHERDITSEEQKAEEAGVATYRFRKLSVPKHTFVLEEDEYSLIAEKVKDQRDSTPAMAADEFEAVLNAIGDCEQYEAKEKATKKEATE